MDKKLADHSGDVTQKGDLRKKASNTVGVKARACAVYFAEHSDAENEAALDRPASYYTRLKDEEIVSILRGKVKIMSDNVAVLADYGVDTTWLGVANDQINDLEKLIGAPEAGRQSNYAGDGQINEYIGQLMDLYGQFDALVVNAFDAGNHDFVVACLATGVIITLGRHHNIVDVKGTKAADGSPINRLKIEIINPEDGKVLKTFYTDAEGNGECFCRLKLLYARASGDGFVTQQKTFKPVRRGTILLEFGMASV